MRRRLSALGGLRRRPAGLVLPLQQAPPQPQPDRSPPCRGRSQGAGPDIPDASRTPPPPGCRYEQSPPRGPAVHVYSSRAREPGSLCPGPSPIGSASRRQPTCRGTEVGGQVQRAGVAGRREGRGPAGCAACPAGNRMGPGGVCRVGGGRSEAADLGYQRPRRVQSAPTWRGGLNGNSPRRAPAPRYAAD